MDATQALLIEDTIRRLETAEQGVTPRDYAGFRADVERTVDLLLARYKPETRAKVNVFIYAIISAFCIMLFVFGVGLCNNPIIRRGVTTGLNISRLWLYMSLPISMFFSSLIAVYKLITATVDLVKGGKGK